MTDHDGTTQKPSYNGIAFDDHVRARQRAAGAGNRVDDRPNLDGPTSAGGPGGFAFEGMDRMRDLGPRSDREIRATIERVIIVDVAAADANCSKHIKPRWDRDAVEERIDLYRADIEKLRAEVDELTAEIGELKSELESRN